jgi:hypothetical protein
VSEDIRYKCCVELLKDRIDYGAREASYFGVHFQRPKFQGCEFGWFAKEDQRWCAVSCVGV